MTLTPGTRIGPYEVQSSLGSGGMGQVFKARDTRLGRIVAVKAMHALVAEDPERVTRFTREAQLLASLNHPNIAAIHGVEEAAGASYLVLEFVDGRTLSDILQSGALPIDEALGLAKQIAHALAAAHERGIIHRDLKPGNVMVTTDGHVKVLDFGLGKAIEGDASRISDPSAPPAHSPTMTMAATQAGIILGTAGYMSPEQAKGRATDKRSDVWAFGCVLYELISGKRAFDGEDITEILAAIVRGEPDWNALPASTPAPIRELIQRCLVKNRAERLADMSVVQYVLGERPSQAAASTSGVAPSAGTRSRRAISYPLAAGFVILAIAATAAVMRWWPAGEPSTAGSRLLRVSVALPDGDQLVNTNRAAAAISPDGTLVVYSGARAGRSQLFLRSLTEADARPLPGTENGLSPFFSPDSRWIGFFAQGKLKKVTVGGTAMQDIADAPDNRGGSWAVDDTIYFAPTNVSGIMKVSASGGTATELTRRDQHLGEISHRWPHVLPDGKTILFTVWTGPGEDEKHMVRQTIGTSERHALVRGGDTPRYVTPGFLVYGRLDGLFAVPWQPAQLDLGGGVPITLPQSPRLENEGNSAYAVSDDGTLIYLAGGESRIAYRVVWVDRAGKTEPLAIPDRDYESAVLSPDDRQALLQIYGATTGLWMYDFSRRSLTPFTTNAGSSQAPLWTTDGTHVIYRATRKGLRNLYWKPADGTGAEEPLTTKPDVVQAPTSVSPDGEWLLFNEQGGPSGAGSIWKLHLTGDRTPAVVVPAALDAVVSPDGKWIAFMALVEGGYDVFAQPFPGPGPRQPISIGGGWLPRWSRDSKELFYASRNNERTMVVTIGSGTTLQVGTPRSLYDVRFRETINGNTPYDVARDGRFLRVQRSHPDYALTSINIVFNWFDELRRVAGAR